MGPQTSDREADTIDEQGPIVVAGIGRVGQIVTRLLVTNGSLSLKKEIRRRLGVEKDQLPAADYFPDRAGLFCPAR